MLMVIRPRPRLPLIFAQFSSKDYPTLTGALALPATKVDIIRSMLMTGYWNIGDSLATVGVWRVNLLKAMIEGYLDSNLHPTTYYLALEPSERVSMTFLIAQGLTHWVADYYMMVPILMHLSGQPVGFTVASSTAGGKTGAGKLKEKGRPDFIGIGYNEYHVFESKGRSLQAGITTKSSAAAKSPMKGALAQVSRIDTINGMTPKTRTGAVWILRPGAIAGFITDPPAGKESFHMEFDLREALFRYYRLIIDAAVLRASPVQGKG